MAKYHFLFLLASSFLVDSSWLSVPFLVAASGTESVGSIVCRTGWTSTSETDIPKKWINDGYCDCPFDGKDEPDTNACSGSLSWAGIDTTTSKPPTTDSTDYVCPKQPALILPSSRLHDGICDCCDGSDEDPRTDPNHRDGDGEERTNPCPDDCEQVMKAERERLNKVRNDFAIGSRKRDADLVSFAKIRQAKIAEVSGLGEKLAAFDSEIKEIEEKQIVETKQTYVASRVDTMKDEVVKSQMASSLLSVLDTKELEDLLVHLCQIAGEIAVFSDPDLQENTCLALRVAALDLGLTWSDEDDYEGTMEATFQNASTGDIVDVIFQNAVDAKDGNGKLRLAASKEEQKKRPSKGRRRLDEVNDDHIHLDDDYMPTDDDMMDRYGYEKDDDDGFRDSERRDRIKERSRSNKKKDSKEHSEAEGKEKEFVDHIRDTLFSLTRKVFWKESELVIGEITTILDGIAEEEKGESKNSEETEEVEEEDTAEATFDPMAFKVLRNSLNKQRDIVTKGLRWGASASLLLGAEVRVDAASNESVSIRSRSVLERLVIGTIFYGDISALQTWQILQAILPEYKSLSPTLREEEATCASPWSGNCPPKQILRDSPDGGDIEYPPSFLLEVATSFCDQEASNFGKEGALTTLTCHQENNSDIRDAIESLASLPSSSEGQSFFGYVVPTKRDPMSDPFRTMLKPIEDLLVDSDGVDLLLTRRDSKKREKDQLSKEIERIWKEVGGRSGTALGRDGELHSIKDKCFDIVAGKYTYEVCLFGKAQQKEGKSGTDLGRWERIEYEEDKDNSAGIRRVLKWENGRKCWNGPKRTATVYMKCGPDHKLISANEPDTCRYVFEMESYLACDEAYKRSVGL